MTLSPNVERHKRVARSAPEQNSTLPPTPAPHGLLPNFPSADEGYKRNDDANIPPSPLPLTMRLYSFGIPPSPKGAAADPNRAGKERKKSTCMCDHYKQDHLSDHSDKYTATSSQFMLRFASAFPRRPDAERAIPPRALQHLSLPSPRFPPHPNLSQPQSLGHTGKIRKSAERTWPGLANKAYFAI